MLAAYTMQVICEGHLLTLLEKRILKIETWDGATAVLLPSGDFSVTSSHLKSNNSKTCFLKLSDLTFVSDSLNSRENGRGGGEKGGEGLRWQAVDLAEEILSWNKCRKLSCASKETVRMGWRKRYGLVCDRNRHMAKFVSNKCWVKRKEPHWVVLWRI